MKCRTKSTGKTKELFPRKVDNFHTLIKIEEGRRGRRGKGVRAQLELLKKTSSEALTD